MAKPSLSGVLSDNTRQTYDQIIIQITTYVFHHKPESPKALLHARFALLDALGCAMETLTTSPECVRMIGPVAPGTVVPNGFRLPGTSYQLDPVKGAFDLGILIRFLDHSDGFYGAEWGHPSDNLGAILAVSDWLNRALTQDSNPSPRQPPLTVSTLLTALIKAYEVQGCFQVRNSFNALGLDHVVLVKLSATAVTYWLLGLSESETHAALSQVWMDGQPLRTYRHAPNTGSRKGWAGGDACMRAVHLSLLTKAGQAGAPTALTAPRWGFYATTFRNQAFSFDRPFGTWVMENIFFKLIPAEGHAISALEAVLQIADTMAARGLDPDQDISKIRVRTHAGAILIINKSGKLYNAADRDHCMQYMMAVTFLKGAIIEYVDYTDESPWAKDQRVDRLRAKIELVEEKQFSRDYLDVEKRSAANGVTVVLQDSKELEEVLVEYPLGHALRKETLSAVSAKIRKNLGRAFSQREIERIIQSTERQDMPIKDFVDLFAKSKELRPRL